MSDRITSRAVPGCLWPVAVIIGAAPALALVITLASLDSLFLVWAVRVLVVLALALATGYAVVGLWGLITRWASPRARVDATSVALARAEHMALPAGLHSLSLSAPRGRELAPVPQIIDAVPAPELPPAPPEFAYGKSRLLQLVDRGHVARSGDQVLVGYDDKARPRYVEAPSWGLMLIAGQSGKGKSTAAALIIAQAALAGWELMICDPAYHRPRSLLREYLSGLTGAIYRQAVRPHEIAHTIGLAVKIARRRIDGERWQSRVLLVVDDFSVLAGSGALDNVVEALALISLQCSAAGVHILLLAHDMTGSWFGGQVARRFRGAGQIRLVFNMQPDAARAILPGGEAARQVAVLPAGQALFFDGADTPALITVPQMSAEDLAHGAQGRQARPYQPWEPPQLAAPAQPSSIPPTVPIGQPSEPPAAPPWAAPPTCVLDLPMAQRILDVLAGEPAGLPATAVAAITGEPLATVKSRLAELRADGVIDARKAPQGRHFVYSLIRRPSVA